jgi:acetolactate synthase-1/2/3 large subunit
MNRLQPSSPPSLATSGPLSSVAAGILGLVADAGVDAIFGIPGGAISPFLGALRAQERVRFVIACHEAGAAFMADGYARASDRLGVCLVTAGPGATNALTGAAAAHLDGVPVLLISGEVPTDRWGEGALQESTAGAGIDVVGIYRHALAHSVAITHPMAAPRLFRRALAVTQRRPASAVHVSIPADVARAPAPGPFASPLTSRRLDVGMDGAAVDDLLDALLSARRPLLVLGSGSRRALARSAHGLADWAEREGIAVATTLRAKGIFPESSAASLGVFGLAGSPRCEAMMRAGVDVLVIVGSRLGDWSICGAARESPASRVIQIDADPSAIGRALAVDVGLVADADSLLRDLLVRAQARPTSALAAERRRAQSEVHAHGRGDGAPQTPEDPEGPVRPQRLMAALQAHLGGDLDLYVDMGNCTGWTARCLSISPPTRLFVPCGLSTMGWSCGAVIGGKIARPERRAVALVGDGAFLMNGTEVNTAARHRVGAVYVVLQDDALGMVAHGEQLQTGHPLGDGYYSLGAPDLVAFADALGADAWRVDRPGELQAALSGALVAADRERKPQVVVVRIDPAEAPPYGDRFRAVSGRGGEKKSTYASGAMR